ncbi:MAG TPA: Imm10 family immunity protein [Burkholderiaceae bacterium]
MNIQFIATKVFAGTEENSWTVGFADHEFETKEYLFLQRASVVEQQDVDIGHDSYHVEINDQSCSCYGGIESAKLWRNRIEIAFLPKASTVLQNTKIVKIQFDVDDLTFAALSNHLALVLSGVDIFQRCE